MIDKINNGRWGSKRDHRAKLEEQYLDELLYGTAANLDEEIPPEMIAEIRARVHKTIKWERRKDLALMILLAGLTIAFLLFVTYRFIDTLIINRWVA